MCIQANVINHSNVVEINIDGQLRELDEESYYLKSDAINAITESLKVRKNEIVDMEVLKRGMTNRSFLFTCKKKKYIIRIPGEGTAQLVSRKEEADVYRLISGKGICDNIVYINPDNGYKITEYLNGVRCCDPNNVDDL